MLVIKYDIENFDIQTCSDLVQGIKKQLEEYNITEPMIAIPSTFDIEQLEVEDDIDKLKREWGI